MKNLLRNFYLTLVRFKTASILNILGLTVAFTVFIIIMMQSNWELTYNKSIKDYDRIYRVIHNLFGDKWMTNICRPMGEEIGKSLPQIESYTLLMNQGSEDFKTMTSQGVIKNVYGGQGYTTSSFPEVFSLECLAGDFKKFEEPATVLIPKSFADKLCPDEDAIGQLIISGNDTATIVAVYKDFSSNSTIENNVYYNLGKRDLEYFPNWNYTYYYKLNSADALPELQKWIRNYFIELRKGWGDEFDEESVESEPLVLESLTKSYYSLAGEVDETTGNKALTNILISVAFIFILIAIINYINFFMALIPIRIRFININKVFGTPVSALRLNIIGEAVGIILLSFGLSLVLLHGISDTFIKDLMYCSIKLSEHSFVLMATGVFAVCLGIFTGLFPAFYITKFQPAFVLKGSFGRSKKGQRLRSGLIVFQFTISIVLIIAASFVFLQNRYLQNYDYGFNRNRLVTVWVGDKIVSQSQAFKSELRKNPAIVDVAYSQGFIIHKDMMAWTRQVQGEPQAQHFNVMPVSWHYPEFMELQLLEGRLFIEEDEQKYGGTLIFNETAAKKYGIKVGELMGGHIDDVQAEVVGIVKDFHFASLTKPIEPLALYEFGNDRWYYPSLAYIRLAPNADLQASKEFITNAMKAVNPNVNPEKVKITPFENALENFYTKERNLTKAIGVFSLIAIIISLMGVFGIVVFENQHRRKEIAIRKIHGSTARLILGMFNRKFIIILSICFVIAAPIAYFGVTKWLSGFAYRIPVFWWVFVAGFLVVAFITLLTVTLQTFRSANENPAWALKTE